MLHKQPFFLLLFILIVNGLYAQTKIQGRIWNRNLGTPVSFANIGIINTPVGTISNEDGSFSITIPQKHIKDTLLFSALGFGRRLVAISSFVNPQQVKIYLSEKISKLEGVTITAKKENARIFQLGNRHFTGGNLYADSIATGSAMALLIENKYPAFHEDLVLPSYLKSARLRVFRNTEDSFKVRVRIYNVDSVTGFPDKDLLERSIVARSVIRKGWLEVDLTSINFKVDRLPFFLVFEWILEDKDRLSIIDKYLDYKEQSPEKVRIDTSVVDGEKITFYSYNGFYVGTLFGVSYARFSKENYKTFYRENSFGKWKRCGSILTANVSLSNQPFLNEVGRGIENLHSESLCKEDNPICKTEKLVEDFLENEQVYGAQLTVSKKGSIVFSKGFGLADVEKNIPVSSLTRFRIGSISKSLTSAALIQLIDENKLNLDFPVRKYVPAFPQKKYDFSTRQLAGHLAGIRHYKENDIKDLVRTEHFKTTTEALKIFENDSLLFKPGSKYFYSSYGWNFIGAIIEGISKERYLDYMYKHIWKPLGMYSTYGDVADSTINNKSEFYYSTGEKAEFEDLSYKYSGGGLISNTEDLVKYGNELLHGKFFNQSLVPQLFTPQKTSSGEETAYGIGWNVTNEKGHRIWYHAGSLTSSSAYLMIYPDDDIIVAFLANGEQGLYFEIQKVAEYFFNK